MPARRKGKKANKAKKAKKESQAELKAELRKISKRMWRILPHLPD
jgi:hypothetical protein